MKNDDDEVKVTSSITSADKNTKSAINITRTSENYIFLIVASSANFFILSRHMFELRWHQFYFDRLASLAYVTIPPARIHANNLVTIYTINAITLSVSNIFITYA